MLQSMADASPSKWHLAHTTWFFERFVLAGFASAPAHDPAWDYLFNSYYKSIGPAHARPQRGLLSRPSLQQVRDYRQQVDAQVQSRLAAGDLDAQALHHLQLGLQHEQQHQELLLTDIKHAFWCNPLQPAYREDLQPAPALPVRRAGPNHPNASSPLAPQPGRSMPPSPTTTNRRRIACCSPHTHWQSVPSAMASTSPSSRLAATASRAGGSAKAGRCARNRGLAAPAVLGRCPAARVHPRRLARAGPACAGLPPQLLRGRCLRPLGGCAPAQRVRVGSRRCDAALRGHFADDDQLHPRAGQGSGLRQLFGDVWEWTHSAYGAYPGFRPFAGNLGEYNGKFMCGQWVLRGGSCATPRGHVRASYRNFFMPRHVGSSPGCAWPGSRMSTVQDALQALTDLTPGRQQILADVVAGLLRTPRQLPSSTSTMHAARACSSRSRIRQSTTHAHRAGPAFTGTAGHRPKRRAAPARCGTGQRQWPQDRVAAGRPARPGGLHAD